MDIRRAHPLLSQVPLAINPAVQPPKAVTLPYNYHRLPEKLANSAVDVDTLERIIMDSSGFLDALDSRHTERVEAFENWTQQVKEAQLKEQRRIAPGYLDAQQRILEPDRQQEPKSQDSSKSSSPSPSHHSNEIDKAFGHLSMQ